MVKKNADRSWYKRSAKLLKSMLKHYDKTAIYEFVEQLRKEYKQRKALLDELKIIGNN